MSNKKWGHTSVQTPPMRHDQMPFIVGQLTLYLIRHMQFSFDNINYVRVIIHLGLGYSN